ncbi:LOW QUALITY PROTEIN: ankyrin repeat domain-containing protein 24-like [Liolophura sinensis]|uniref:LOW QUALITY PROTEIN: ankyrin repeat domain-containing protein 24-like n=1 Tax=Liolophura sinensis TaxID=3198878 RepID=UPI0031593DB7
MAKVKRLFRFHKSTTDLSEWNKNDDKLLKAVERGDVAKVDSLLNRKTLLPTKPGPKGMSVFQMAAGSGQLTIVERFLAYGGGHQQHRSHGSYSVAHGCQTWLASDGGELLMMGANQNCVDSDHMSAVHYACGSSHLPCVQSLIQYRANVNSKDKSGRSPLFYCARGGEVRMCKLLLDNGADINLQDHFGRTALIFAASKGHREVCELLLKHGANAECRDEEGLKAVEYSIKAGHTDLQEVFDNALVQASWEVTGGDSGTPEGTDNNSDIVNPFSPEDSPTTSAKQSAPKFPKDSPSAPSTPKSPHSWETTPHSPSTTDQRTMDAYKELEEEHELLMEELRALRVSHIKLQDKLQFITERSQKSGENGADNQRIQALENELKKIKNLYSAEQEKNMQLETKIEKHGLRSESPSESPGGVDSWEDSDDDLFGNPTEKKPKSGTGRDDQLVALLRSQILSLRQENDHLKEKLQNDSSVTNGVPSLSQSPLTHSISGLSEGESGILMNGERSRTPSDEGDVAPRDETSVREENQILKETIKKMQVTYSALVEAGDKLQIEYDQLYEEKMVLEEKLQVLTKEKEELTKENNILAAENLHEDIEKLLNELETLQQKNKQLEKEKEELSRQHLGLTINSGVDVSGELARVTEERDALKLHCDELEETAARLKQDHDIVIEEIQSVQERFSYVQTDRDQLQQELDLIQDELEKLTQQYEVCQQEYNQLEQDYAELLAEKGKLEQDILNVEVGSSSESNQTISPHEQEVLIQQNSILSEEKEVLENKVLKLETSKHMLETELDSLKDKGTLKVKVSDDNQNIVTTSPNSTIPLSTSPLPDSSEKDKQIRSLQVRISRLQQQVTEMERKHKDTVSTYRTHLISAVQGRMHPEVQEALHHIIDLRSKEEYC